MKTNDRTQRKYGAPQRKSARMIWIILLIIAVALWVDWPGSGQGGRNLGPIHLNRSLETRYGLDLVGGVQALMEADLPAKTAVDPNAMHTARAIVEKRVNGLGISETVVQQAGDRRILVEMPGETDPEHALAALQKTGLLEFVDFSNLSDQQVAQLVNTTIQTDYGQTASGSQSASSSQPLPSTGSTETPITTTQSTAPITTTQTTTSTSPITSTAGTQTPHVFHTVMTGDKLESVGVTTTTGSHEVNFKLTGEGSTIFKDYTTAHVGSHLAIVLDKQVISAPVVQNAITTGQGVITGNFTTQAANDLAIQLRYGSLPIPLKVVSSQTVGPTLGQSSLHKSLIAGIIGLSSVALFMILYYRLPGLVAVLALLVYAMITLALFKWIGVTLTLPGIAGFVLSIGVAVDANILIFSRIREELRAGKPLNHSIDLGWSRAWPSIRDSNISTLITCTILFWFGSAFGASIVKGFSLNLALGVLVSMFTAIVVTRTFLHLVLDRIDFASHTVLFGV